MSMRFTPDEAVAMGIISKTDAQHMKQNGKRGATPAQERLMKAKTTRPATRTSAAAQQLAKQLASVNDPQTILYETLVKRLPAGAVEWEVPGLIEGRQYRVDILIRAGGKGVIVEMDGFAYHRSKAAFQSDRMRQNLLAAEGYFVFRAFAKQVIDPVMREELVELVAGAYKKLCI